MKMTKAILLVLGGILVIGVLTIQAQRIDKKTTITFSHPVQVPGQTLPAGTYVFTISESSGIRNIVGIWDKDHTTLITKVIAIPNVRLTRSDETTIEFHEAPAGTRKALKAWFYPGTKRGIEFVYPKDTAVQLAQANNEDVPAETVEPTSSTLTTVPLKAVTPQGKEEPIDQAFPAKATQ
jgi:hypothetical protein